MISLNNLTTDPVYLLQPISKFFKSLDPKDIQDEDIVCVPPAMTHFGVTAISNYTYKEDDFRVLFTMYNPIPKISLSDGFDHINSYFIVDDTIAPFLSGMYNVIKPVNRVFYEGRIVYTAIKILK